MNALFNWMLCVFSFAARPRGSLHILINIHCTYLCYFFFSAQICRSSSSSHRHGCSSSSNLGEALHYSSAFFLKRYVHVSGWSQECKCATSLTFTYRLSFEVLCLWLSNSNRHFTSRTCFANHKQSTSNKRVVYVNVSDVAQVHSWWSCCHMCVAFISTQCTTYQVDSCRTPPTPNTVYHTPPIFTVAASFFFLTMQQAPQQCCNGVPIGLRFIKT